MKLRHALRTLTPYVPGKMKTGAVKLASNENPLGPSPLALDRLRRGLSQIHRYPDGDCTALKTVLSERYSLPPDRFIIGNGSDEILLFIAGAYVDPGDTVLTSEATFSEYTFAASLFAGRVDTVPMREGRFDLTTMREHLTPAPRVIFLCNPNNPTGTYINANDLTRFLDDVDEKTLVVLDEAYGEYADARDYPDSLRLARTRPNLLVLRTFSKIFGLAGLRVGYGIGAADTINDLNRAREPFNVNRLAQEAAAAAARDDAFIQRSREMNREGKEYLQTELDRLGLFRFPTQTNFILFRVKTDAQELFLRLMDLGVTVRPLHLFAEQYIRVTIGTMDQNRLFIDCLRQALDA